MPWRVESMRNQKQKFIDLYETRKFTKSELCRHFGISRPTGDAILKRYEEEGYEALDERSRRPRNCPNQTSREVEEALIEKRNKYRWGARKLLVLVQKESNRQNNHVGTPTTVGSQRVAVRK
jgi:transposase